MIRTRFAPSPNGLLHLGHAYAALVAHDLGRGQCGEFLLRIEDIDAARSRADLAGAILADLAWLGLEWDGPVVFQSTRLASYAAAAERLKELGLLYPCRCTPRRCAGSWRIAGSRKGRSIPAPAGGGMADFKARPGGSTWPALLRSPGRSHGTDELAGVQQARPELFGDVVLARKAPPPAITSPRRSMTRPTGSRWSPAAWTCSRPAMSTACSRRCSTCCACAGTITWLLVEGDGRKLGCCARLALASPICGRRAKTAPRCRRAARRAFPGWPFAGGGVEGGALSGFRSLILAVLMGI
ncbi:MAG: glutamate--tRNA ligase family protein [Novosphingobium sp.]